MKKTLILLIMFAAILYAQQTASAQASYVPTFDNKQNSSIHLGFGQLLFDLDFTSSSTSDVEVEQNIAIFGANWEHHHDYGFFHCRLGYIGLGETETTSGSSTNTSSAWEDNQDIAFYIGCGYLFLAEMPLGGWTNGYDPNMGASQPQAGLVMFYGGGLDFNLYAMSMSNSTISADSEESLYVFDVALVGIVGVRMPQVGFILHVGISGHILLGWEYRSKVESPTSTSVMYLSDHADLEIPFLGMQAGVTYEVPTHPRLRFGVLAKIINSNMIIFHVGYVF